MQPSVPNPSEKGYIVSFDNGDRQIVPSFDYGNFSSYKKHLVDQDDTLLSIANTYYKDTSCWVLIAEANILLNPIELEVGTILLIPSKYGS